ncbi:MAG: MFS transporter [Gordonia sp. (in: high G+C Gram-positive bacteria)]
MTVISEQPASPTPTPPEIDSSAASLVADPQPTGTGRARTIALICLLVASFMELMDATVVNVALRTIEVDLSTSATTGQWIVAGYPLAYAVALIVGARLGDRFGRRRLFIIGLIGFGMASLACGLAADAAQLVGFRVIQGTAAAVMVPQVLTSIQVLYPPAERGKAMGLFTSVIGLAAVSGPVLGAVIASGDWFGLSWRPIFLINVPIAVIAVICALAFIPETQASHPAPLTTGTAALLGGSLAAIMLPITLGPENDWPAWGFVAIAAGVGGLVIFARRQVTAARAGMEPMVPPQLFATRSFTTGILTFAALTVPTGGYFLVQSLYVQTALGWSVLHAGLMWIPFSLAVPVAAGLSATLLAPRVGRLVLPAGATVFGAGMIAMWFAASSAHPGWWFVPALTISGLGFGLIVGSAGLLVLHDVPVALAGAASGMFNTVQALSVALGAAIIGTAYTTIRTADGLHSGYRTALVVMIALLAAGAVLAGSMPRR